MGFWSSVGELAKKAGNAALDEAKAANDRTKVYKAEMPNKSDDELVQIISKDMKRSPLKASAATRELKSRGYSPEEIKNMIKTS
jgi:hypothetical protein